MSNKTMNASELMLRKIASRDATACLLVKQAALMKTSGIGQWLSDIYGKAKDGLATAGQATKDYFMDVNNIKDLGIGAATTAGTYALSGLVPGADKYRGYRLLASLAAGTGATIYGDEIRGGAQALWDKTPWGKQEIARANAEAQALADERAGNAKAIKDRDATIADRDATIGGLKGNVSDLQNKLTAEQGEVARLQRVNRAYVQGINDADLGGVFTNGDARKAKLREAIATRLRALYNNK